VVSRSSVSTDQARKFEMSLKWIIRPQDNDLVRQICESSGVSPVIAQVLAMRNITRLDEIQLFLDPKMNLLVPPNELPGVPGAVAAIDAAISAGQKIVVYGDYDCDGMTATAILYRCLKLLGADVSYVIPCRVEDGYGLNAEQIRRLAGRGCQLLVTVDCGIASVEDVALARELGLGVIVTDHHQPGERLPDANAIVHPALAGSTYPFPHLCGAGVAFKLAWALFMHRAGSEKLPANMRDQLFQSIALAAIGTVADVVSLTGENRILVHHGLNLMRSYGGAGLAELSRLAKIGPDKVPSAEDIAFALGPRLNAAGRLGPGQLGVELLVTDQASRAAELAEYIDNLNNSRGSIERSIMIAARKMIEADFDPVKDSAIVISGNGWNKGVIGIVAGRLAEKYHRPVVVISVDPVSDGPQSGSARTALGVDLYRALENCREHLVNFGGHRAAAGLQIMPDDIEQFREEFLEQVESQIAGQERISELEIDVEAPLCQLTAETVVQLEKLAPFGAGNSRPVLCATGLELVGEPRAMGSDGRHLSLTVRQDGVQLRCVAFGKAEWSGSLQSDGSSQYDFAFKPVINDFRGRRNVELHLIDFRPTRLEQLAAS